VRVMSTLKLLLIAPFVCEQSIGEGASTYQLVSRLARKFNCTVLTYNLRADTPAGKNVPEARVVEWRDLPIVGRFSRLNSQLTPGYIPFFLRARNWLRKNLKREGFDLIHQLAPLALRYPCPAVGLGAPYIIGPLGGSLEAPPSLQSEVEREPLYRKLRALDGLRFRYDPLLRATYSQARVLIVVAPYVSKALASIELPPLRFMSEAGVERVYPRLCRSLGAPPRLLFVGRVIRTKGVRDAIRSIGHLSNRDAILDIVGDGEDVAPCMREVASLGLQYRVRFHGYLPRAAVDAFYERADLFVFPSFREPSGKAVLEAMSHGVPVVAANYGGPAVVVDETCGRLVDPAPPDVFARSLAAEIDSVLANPLLRDALGEGAARRIEEQYTWNKKVDWLCNLYREVL